MRDPVAQQLRVNARAMAERLRPYRMWKRQGVTAPEAFTAMYNATHAAALADGWNAYEVGLTLADINEAVETVYGTAALAVALRAWTAAPHCTQGCGAKVLSGGSCHACTPIAGGTDG